MMRFKVDENLPLEIALSLREAGHDALTVMEQDLGGGPDPMLADTCRREHRALVTLDLDFGDIHSYPPQQYPGIIVLRLTKQDKPRIMQVFDQVVPLLKTQPVLKHLWIVDEQRVRIRGEGKEEA